MVADDLFNLVDKFGVVQYTGLEDFADKMNFLFTVIILLIISTVVTIKSYIIRPIACYVNTVPSGGDFEEYFENYCWIHGTVPLYPGQSLPSDWEKWDTLEKLQKISYYQWVPFILGIQCIMFYLPRLLWQIFCFNKGGTNLEMIIRQAVSISEKPVNERHAEYQNIAKIIENMLVLHRDFREGKAADMRRKIFRKCSLFMNSKRLGTMLVFWYFVVKLLYLGNAICQLFIIQIFLGFKSYVPSFGFHLVWYILSGTEFELQNYFPRIVFCHTRGVHHLGTKNSYTAQCVLPINMLNEKIYTFLWCWIFIIAIITAISIPLWVNRLFRGDMRDKYIKNFLKMVESYEEHKCPLIHRFVNDFMRHDGMFLLRMISNNAGDLMAAYLVKELWTTFLITYQNRNLRNDLTQSLDCFVIDLKPGNINAQIKARRKCSSTNSPLHYL